MDHPTGQVVGFAPEPWYPFRGPPVTSGIDEWRDGPERAQRAGWKASLGNDGFGRFQTPEQFVQDEMSSGLFGTALRERIESFAPRMFRISYATEQLPRTENFLEITTDKDILGVPKVRLHYRVDEYTRSTFPAVRTTLLRIFDHVGISHVRLESPTAYGGSGHVLGTCRMAKKAEDGVVDRDGRSFSIPSLFVVGSATFPTIGTANPTLTVAALALRTASILEGEL